jgi:hypothetical protein
MGKIGGARNYGFGKQMAWAGRQAVADRYGEGHFASCIFRPIVNTHSGRT